MKFLAPLHLEARILRLPQCARLLAFAIIGCALAPAGADDATANRSWQELSEWFQDSGQQILESHCHACHTADDPDGGLDLERFQTADQVARSFAHWRVVLRRLEQQEMPPPEESPELSEADRQRLIDWIKQVRQVYAAQHAGDPGPVLAHRLNAQEYNYSIRDLTGVDLRPAESFPVDAANEAGFDHTGESLMMTPALLAKYFDAAKSVADHMVFAPDGLRFADHPMLSESDRDKYVVRRIIDFYQRVNVDLADYLFVLASYLQRDHENWDLSDEVTSLQRFASVCEKAGHVSAGLSAPYLARLQALIDDPERRFGPVQQLRKIVEQPLTSNRRDDQRRIAEQTRELIRLRRQLSFEFPRLSVSGINRGSQTLVLWRNRQKANHRMSLNEQAMASAGLDAEDAQVLKATQAFCELVPDAYFIDRRGREYIGDGDEPRAEGNVRLLSAGFHSMMGYFRDDQPLCKLILNEQQVAELNQLWQDLNFIADVPARQHSGFIWFERAEGRYLVDSQFDAFQAADRNNTKQEMIFGLRDAYIEKATRSGADEQAVQAMQEHFEKVNQNLRQVESLRLPAEQRHIEDLIDLAERAYRRPLTEFESQDLRAFYRELTEQAGLSHQDACRDVLISLLVSPNFCFRSHEAAGKAAIEPLTDYELATRLSYFLWSSVPDQELLQLAKAGKLRDAEVLAAQVRRMLDDNKSEALATEFVGNWLGHRRFMSHTGVDRSRYPEFDETLQSAMYREPIVLMNQLIKQRKSLDDLLFSKVVYVNRPLAKHYGIPWPKDVPADQWISVDGEPYGRGGVLSMAVFLTQHSPGLRTSPVKRGYWVVRQILGTEIPAPPPDVPEFPEDESKLGELTVAEVLQKHREHASCAACHDQFDSFGLVFEGFGPVGKRRRVDLGGRDVDTRAVFPDGVTRSGIQGLQNYLGNQRRDDFVDHFCRKLLSYALGRSLILSDEVFLDDMKQSLQRNDGKIESAIMQIVTSDLFLNKRGNGYLAAQ